MGKKSKKINYASDKVVKIDGKKYKLAKNPNSVEHDGKLYFSVDYQGNVYGPYESAWTANDIGSKAYRWDKIPSEVRFLKKKGKK